MVEETVETMSYILFVYQEELRRKKARVIRLSKQKLQLTEKLVMRNSSEINNYSEDELENFAREILYKEKLEQRMERIEALRKIRHERRMGNCRSDNFLVSK